MVVYKKDNNRILVPLMLRSENTKWTTPIPISQGILRAITYGNGKFVAVGENGYIYSSTDGVTWTESLLRSGIIYNWYAITYGNGKFVVVGNKGYISTSEDGVSWTEPVQLGTNAWRAITYGNGKFVTVGDNSYISTSEDGVTWTEPLQVRSTTNAWRAITYGNGKFVTVGDNGIGLISTDGEDWSIPVLIGAEDLYAITYGNGKFVAVGDKGYIYSSTDGVTWASHMLATRVYWRGVTYGNKFVAIGFSSLEDKSYVSTSLNGNTWSPITEISKWQCTNITYGANKFITVSWDEDNVRGGIITLPNYRSVPFTLAYGKDVTYGKNTGIASVPVIYVKNDESLTIHKPDDGFLNIVGSIQSISLYEPEILTGFSSTSYGEFNMYFPPTSSSIVQWDSSYWTWVFTFKHHQTNVIQSIFSQGKSYPSGLEIGADNKLCLTMSTSKSSYNIVNAVKGTTILEDGKWYQVAVGYLGGLPTSVAPNGYEVRLKDLDNDTETLEIYSTKRTNISETYSWLLGYEPKKNNGKTAFSGELDLKNCYINVGGERFWSGTDGTITVDKNNYDIKTEKIRRYI